MKIIPILLNPTIDQIYEIDNFEVGGTFKVNESIIYPVGKAISFALGVRELSNAPLLKVIACIGQDEISLYSSFLRNKDIAFEFIPIKGATRSNKTINDPVHNTTTHIREKGFEMDEDEIAALKQKLTDTIESGDICVFSGSLPPNLKLTMYQELIDLAKKGGALTVLDTSGDALTQGLKAGPAIIKPNLIELNQILKDKSLNEALLEQADGLSIISEHAKQLLSFELSIILITLGAKGALCITKDQIFYGNIHVDKVVDTVGSGDSFLAGFILNYYLKKDLLECFQLALAAGAANTLVPGPGIFNKEDAEALLPKATIRGI